MTLKVVERGIPELVAVFEKAAVRQKLYDLWLMGVPFIRGVSPLCLLRLLEEKNNP